MINSIIDLNKCKIKFLSMKINKLNYLNNYFCFVSDSPYSVYLQ